ncbi:MAG: hypothetical protein WD184_01160 [Acidimicrobiia bacterium]
MASRPSSNSIALAGEFAVLSQLAINGIDGGLTLGNTKGVDILVSDPDTNDMYQLEVKTHLVADGTGATGTRGYWGHNFVWLMDRKHESPGSNSLFYCFVLARRSEPFRFFVVPSDVTAHYVRGQHALWLSGDEKRRDNTRRQFRLALSESGYPLPTPIAARYEDNWSFSRQSWLTAPSPDAMDPQIRTD